MTWNNVVETPPETIENWNTEIIKAGLHLKWSPQLREMHDLWVAKLPRLEIKLAEEQISSGLKVERNMDGTFEVVGRAGERLDNIANYERKIKRGKAVIKLCKEEERIRVALEAKGQVFDTPDKYKRDGSRLDVSEETALILPETVIRSPVGTDYFIDADSGDDANDGLGTGTAWKNIKKYTQDTTRSAGDTATVRRGTAAQYAASNASILFDDDGTAANYIFLKADNVNAFGDDVDLSATATATFAFGSKTVIYSSDISGVLAVNDWIYEVNDDAELYAYMVKTVSTVTVTLYLPYKGMNEGSGKTTTNIQTAPVVGTLTDSSTNLNISNDNFWNISGIHVKTNTFNGAFDIDVTASVRTKDMVLEIGATTTNDGLRSTTDGSKVFASKFIILNAENAVYLNDGNILELKDSFIDCNSIANSNALRIDGTCVVIWDDVEAINHVNGVLGFQPNSSNGQFRNCILAGSTSTLDPRTSDDTGGIYIEDSEQVVSKNIVYTATGGVNDDPIYQSDTGTVRSGGSNVSIKITPTTLLDEILLLDIPIKHNTSATTYTIHVKTNATADWTADPTASELELSFEAWGHATNNHRKMNLSTDVADFNGVTTWETLAVTVTAAQAGTGYLRLKYRKPKESGKSNEFYVDPIPLFS